MRLEMEELRNAKPPVSKDTPPPKVKGPTPAATPQAQRKKPSPSEVACAQKQSEPQTEGARMARLRRLCEKKPSGRCWVPEEVHLRWAKGSKEEREKMCEELEDAHWSKETAKHNIANLQLQPCVMCSRTYCRKQCAGPLHFPNEVPEVANAQAEPPQEARLVHQRTDVRCPEVEWVRN